jgi:hypothetical protein
MAQRDKNDRATHEPTPGGATGGAGIGASAVSPDSPGNDQSGIVGSGAVWHHDEASAAPGDTSFAGSKPGVLGDETEEQNLDQPGNPDARIGKDEVEAAFAGDKPRPKYPDELVAPDDGDQQ